MKNVIWAACLFLNACITTIVKENGVILGAIPTVVLYLATIWLARTLCRKWDEHKGNTEVQSKVQYQPSPQPATEREQERIMPVSAPSAAKPASASIQPVVKNTVNGTAPRKAICPHCGAHQPDSTGQYKYCCTAVV